MSHLTDLYHAAKCGPSQQVAIYAVFDGPSLYQIRIHVNDRNAVFRLQSNKRVRILQGNASIIATATNSKLLYPNESIDILVQRLEDSYLNNETWEHDGAAWAEQAPGTSPPARANGGSARGRVP